jgi:16S rRNA (uracil1498-N3)-methyltransferase
MIAILADPGTLVAGSWLTVPDSEAHHLRVRRAAEGSEVRLLDGEGNVGSGVLGWNKKSAMVQIARVAAEPRPPELTLAVGAGDRDRLAWLAEKSAELGVTDLVPLETARTGGVATRLRGDQLDRLQLRAREAIKQSGAAWAPRIHMLMALEELLSRPAMGQRWVGLAGGAPAPAALDQDPLTVAIGPEGGWTDAEVQALVTAGYRATSFGPHVLRFETAALAAAAVIASSRLRGSRD